jgi:HK97 family phage portal protein
LGLLSKWLKPKQEYDAYKNTVDILSGITPIYTTGFGENIFASDVVQQAIYSIVTELKKLDPCHIRMVGNDPIPQSGSIQNVLDAPNPLMTTGDFIEKIAWNLLLNYNAWIYPIWEGNKLKALYPLQPTDVSFDTNFAGTGETWVRLEFANGTQADLPYADIIHLRYKYAFSEFMGGNTSGHPDFRPLLDTLDLNDKLLKGLAKSLHMQTNITGIVKLKQMHNYEDQVKAVKEFEQKVQANASGFLPVDISADYVPLTKQVQLVDATTLEFIDKKILRTFGVSIPIVNGDYNKEQYEAFYQKTLEPIIKSWSQAFTKALFTNRESYGFNNQIKFYMQELIFMNTTQKLEFAKEMGARGSCYENEYRTWFGLRPLPELEGKRMMSLNYIDVNDAQKYQVGKQAKEEPTEPKEGEQDE